MLLNVTLLSYHSGIYLKKSCFRELHLFFFFPLKQQTCRAAETSLYHFILAICFHYIPSFISYFLWPVVTVLTQTIVLPLCHWFVFRGVSSLSVSLKHMTLKNEYCILQMELSAPVSKVQESELQMLEHIKTHVLFQVKPGRTYHGSNCECSLERQRTWREQMQNKYIIKA